MKNKILYLNVIIVLFLFFSSNIYAGEFSTFESFYKESSSIGWVLAAIFAIIAAAIIFFTGGTASPVVVGIGTWIGNMMGLSGIAATNAGLALLGGGSIASGGFGIIGGMAVLTAALSFGTDVVIDFAAGKIITEYSYSKFSEQSKSMATIPLPRNDKGTNSYTECVVYLENNINNDEPIHSNYNQDIIKKALTVLETTEDTTYFSDEISPGNKSRKESLYSILYFLLNEYRKSKNHAKKAIMYAREADRKRTLPAFIFAACSLYEDEFDFEKITEEYFRYSILAEPENPIIPLLFSAYLDRMMYRFNDGYLSAASLQIIVNIAAEKALYGERKLYYPIILSRYFVRLKIEQQKISSLSLTDNQTIKNNPKTLDTLKKSINEYSLLLQGSKSILEGLLFDSELNGKGKTEVNKFYVLLDNYTRDRERLSQMVIKLENYQDNATFSDVEDNATPLYLYISIFISFLVSLYLAIKIPNKTFDSIQKSRNHYNLNVDGIIIRLIRFVFRVAMLITIFFSTAFGIFGLLSSLSPSKDTNTTDGIFIFILFFIPILLWVVSFRIRKREVIKQ